MRLVEPRRVTEVQNELDEERTLLREAQVCEERPALGVGVCNTCAQTRCAVAEGEEKRCRRMLVDVEAAVAVAIRKDNQQYSGILLCEESKAKLQVNGSVSLFTIQAANSIRIAA